MLSHVLVKVGNGGECSLAVLTFGLALVDRYVLCQGILAGEPLIALFTLKRLEASLDRVSVPIAWGQSLEIGTFQVFKGFLNLFKRSAERDPSRHIYFSTYTDKDSKMLVSEVRLQCVSMMLLHMLVQVGNAGEGISTELTVGSALVGLLVVDQSSFAAIRVVASWTNMLLAASCLPSMLLLVVAPVVA